MASITDIEKVANSVQLAASATNAIINTSKSSSQSDETKKNITIKSSQMMDKSMTMLQALQQNAKIFGAPPQFNHMADPRYYKNVDIGRVYSKTYMASPTVFSIAPCGVKLEPAGGLFGDNADSFAQNVMKLASGDQSVKSLVENDAKNGAGKLYQTEYRYNEYINEVNYCMRLIAIMMGIGDKRYPGSAVKYRDFDWANRDKAADKLRQQMYRKPGSMYATYNSWGGITQDTGVKAGLNNIFHDIRETVNKQPRTWVHYYINGEGSDLTENFNTSISQSVLASTFNDGLSGIMKEINFLTGSNYHGEIDANQEYNFQNLVREATAKSSLLGKFISTGKGYLNGAKMIFPDIIDDCTYGKTMSITMRCISPYGDRESIYLYCLAPLFHMLPFVVPQQYDVNMYSFPYIAKVHIKGIFNSDIAVITNFRIKKGGPDDRSWSAEGLPTEIEMSFDVTPMYHSLMLPNLASPLYASYNSSMHEYLAVTTGVDMTIKNYELDQEIMKLMWDSSHIVEAWQRAIERYISGKVGGMTSSVVEGAHLVGGAISGALSIVNWDPFSDE